MRINKDLIAILLLVALVILYTCPLVIHPAGSLDLYPKNTLRNGSYIDLAMINKIVFQYRQMPLWTTGYEGGWYILAHPADTLLNPVSLSLLWILRDEVIVDNLTWVFFYIFAALSMYLLCRKALSFNISGAFLSSIVFSMNGLFPYLQENGFSQARSTLLLPLLVFFFLKAKHHNKYIVYAGLVMAFIIFEAALLVPVIMLFLFFLALFESCHIRKTNLTLDKRLIVVFFPIIGLACLFACIKILPLLDYFGTQVRPAGLSYDNYIVSPNTLDVLCTRLVVPINYWPSLFVGVVPVVLSLFASVFYFRKMKAYVICLILAVWLSFGPNALWDLHRILWHLPFFHEMKEITKYYGLWIVFLMSILCGGFLVFLGQFGKKNLTKTVSIVIITVVFANLAWSNIGYFNSFNTPLKHRNNESESDFFQMALLNGHPGDESISTPLSYFLYQRNIGLLNQYVQFKRISSISPKFFLLPRYAFLMPYTSLLVLPNPFYKGEAFFNTGSEAKIVKFTPNEFIINIVTKGADRLIINQNYDAGWRASIGKVENYNNLLSLNFNRALNGSVKLWYLPTSFITGMFISFSTLIASIIYLLKSRP